MPTFEDTLVGRPNTVRTYRTLFHKWIVGRNEPPEVLQKEWLEAGLSPRTITTLLGLYGRYLEWMGQERPDSLRTTRNLTARMVPLAPSKAMTKDQLGRLSEAWDGLYPQYAGMILAGGHAGLRLGEVLGLSWGDVDFVRSRLLVTKTYDSLRKVCGPTKNGRPRVVPMSKQLEQALLQKYEFDPVASRVFPCTAVQVKVKRACKRAGVPAITYHCLRHTFATLALESGKSVKAVSDALGHSNVSTTINLYWNLVDRNGLSLDFLE